MGFVYLVSLHRIIDRIGDALVLIWNDLVTKQIAESVVEVAGEVEHALHQVNNTIFAYKQR